MIAQLPQLTHGLSFYLWCLASERSVYRGQQRFYRAAMGSTRSGRAAAALLRSPPAMLAVSFDGYLAARERDRISPMAATQYTQDDSLSGYADESFEKGGSGLRDQQRGLILPTLEAACRSLDAQSRVIEIGTGNGDVLAYLAEQFPALAFVGVDFSVATAKRKHRAPNLSFVPGYALELLENGEIRGDLAFASSTFIVFAPRELSRYVAALAHAGVQRVVLNEPTWAGNAQEQSTAAFSEHLEGATWHHNYAGYLAAQGYLPRTFSFFPYTAPASPRPDIRVLVIDAARGAM